MCGLHAWFRVIASKLRCSTVCSESFEWDGRRRSHDSPRPKQSTLVMIDPMGVSIFFRIRQDDGVCGSTIRKLYLSLVDTSAEDQTHRGPQDVEVMSGSECRGL